jgi:hypothetical protein
MKVHFGSYVRSDRVESVVRKLALGLAFTEYYVDINEFVYKTDGYQEN